MGRQGICISGMVDILCWHRAMLSGVSWSYINCGGYAVGCHTGYDTPSYDSETQDGYEVISLLLSYSSQRFTKHDLLLLLLGGKWWERDVDVWSPGGAVRVTRCLYVLALCKSPKTLHKRQLSQTVESSKTCNKIWLLWLSKPYLSRPIIYRTRG